MISWGLISIILGSVGQVLIKMGVTTDLLESFKNIKLWIGIICYGLAFLTWLKVLAEVPLSKAYPLLSGNFILVALLSFLILGEKLSLTTITGTGLCIAGVLVITMQQG